MKILIWRNGPLTGWFALSQAALNALGTTRSTISLAPYIRRIWLALAILAQGLCLAGEGGNRPLRLDLELTDGSRVVGVPSVESLQVQTPYAKMDIALDQILAVAIEADHENASLQLVNGDKLKGVVNLRPIGLKAVFGKVSIPLEYIVRIGVSRGGPIEGLIASYDFDDGSAKDTSGKGNHGIVRDANPAQDRFKRDGRAMAFDGLSSWIEVPSSRLYAGLQGISIALWVCPVDDGRREIPSRCLISKQPSGSLSQNHSPVSSNHGGLFDLEYDTPGGSGQIFFCSQVSSGMSSEGYISRAKPLSVGRWQHLAVTADRQENRLRIYLDGRKTEDVVCSNQVQVGHILSQPNDEPLRIGKRKDAEFTRGYFCGRLDDIRIYNRVLRDSEVAEIADDK